jgi:flavin prenyltransferase
MAARYVLAVTGASGAVYARRVLDGLRRAGAEVHLLASDHGRQVAAAEQGGIDFDALDKEFPGLTLHGNDDLFSPLASGSYPTGGMIVCPCSCNTLSAIATGRGDTLIARAAHVHLKERRTLLLCLREMPLNTIDLKNMLAASEAGAIICPASPAFYGRPTTVAELTDTVAGKILDLLGVTNDQAARWAGRPVAPGHTPRTCG